MLISWPKTGIITCDQALFQCIAMHLQLSPGPCRCCCCCCCQDAVALVKDIKEADKAAHRLVEEAFQRGSNDNISCVVLKFRF